MEGSNSSAWSVARFPSAGSRQDFLDRLRLLSRIEGLPKIEAEPLPDGTRVRLSNAGGPVERIHRLVDCFGGWVANTV